MTEYLNVVLFGIYPYVAMTILFVGSWMRYEYNQSSWRSGSNQFLSGAHLFWGSNLFHIGMLMILFGHIGGLLTPPEVYHALGLTTSTKQLIAIIIGGTAGLICLTGLVILIYRHLSQARLRATFSCGDILILTLLLAQVLLGLASLPISLSHLDGSQMLLLCEWAQRIITLRGGAAKLIGGVHWVFKLHLFLGMTLFAVLPFSRLVHIWSIPLGYLARAYQIVRRK